MLRFELYHIFWLQLRFYYQLLKLLHQKLYDSYVDYTLQGSTALDEANKNHHTKNS